MSSKQVIVVAWEMGSREKGGSVKSNEKKGKARLGLFFITQLKLKVTKMKKKNRWHLCGITYFSSNLLELLAFN